MNAAPQTNRTRLELPPTKAFPRKLIVEWETWGADYVHIHAHAFIRVGSDVRSIAYAGAHQVADVSLKYAADAPVLWIGFAQFELTEAEAAEVERVFGPLGLRVERQG